MKELRLYKKGLALIVMVVLAMNVIACQAGNDSTSSESKRLAEEAATTAEETASEGVTVEEIELPSMAGDEFGEGDVGTHAVVSSFSALSSQIGIDILKEGGNAVDAAVATIFALGVMEPHHSGIGGCGIMTICLEESDEYITIDYLETIPQEQEPGYFNPETQLYTLKAAAVPGQVHGLLEALEKYGTMSREQVMAPAIRLAREGFSLDKYTATAMSDFYHIFEEEGKEYEKSLVTNKDGEPYHPGEIYTNPDLADTLERISQNGIEEFYSGETAERMIEAMQEAGSLMTMEDLANYTSIEREPVTTSYYGYDIVTAAPPSIGGVWLLEMLNILEIKDIASVEQGSVEYWRLLNEAYRIAKRDVYDYIGDPAFYDCPVEEIISKEYAEERAELINDTGVIENIPKSNLHVEPVNRDFQADNSMNTTHISVTDSYGNFVSSTNTIGNNWGCKRSVKGLGFWLNSHINNMSHTNPNSWNYIAPGKRIRSTITPTIVVKDGTPVMAAGSPGSLCIPPAIACVINNVYLYGMDLQGAVNAPRAVCYENDAIGFGTLMTAEKGRIDPEIIEALEEMGFEIEDNDSKYNAGTGCIAATMLGEDGILYGAGDHRRNYKAVAY